MVKAGKMFIYSTVKLNEINHARVPKFFNDMICMITDWLVLDIFPGNI